MTDEAENVRHSAVCSTVEAQIAVVGQTGGPVGGGSACVTVKVALKAGQVWGDPTNASARAHIHGWTEREWRHLDTCRFETVIKAKVSQLKYSNGQVEELTVPWAARYSRVTTLMEGFVLALLQACRDFTVAANRKPLSTEH